MNTIGFSTEYYTLWEVGEPYKKYTSGVTVNGVFSGNFYMVQDCVYKQNLSKDYDKALEKASLRGQFQIDLELRGSHSFQRYIGEADNDMPEFVFTFGQLRGTDIRTAEDVWQLRRAMREERGKRRRVYARRRLIELGELIRNTFGEIAGFDSYIDPSHARRVKEKLEKQAKRGHFFGDGKRIELSVRRIGGTSYETQWGWVFIDEYITPDDKIMKYKGTNPINIGMEVTVPIMATIEHSEYQGMPETRIKRIKIIKTQFI